MKLHTCFALLTACALAALVYTGCTREPGLPMDVDRRGQPMTITVYTWEDVDALNAAAAEIAKASNSVALDHRVDGWSAYDASGSWCQIHVLALRNAGDARRMEVWGHELAHCVHGRYHQ